MPAPSRAAYALALVQSAGFAYFIFPAVFAVLLSARRGGDLAETVGSAVFGLAIAGLGLLFLVGFLFLGGILVIAVLILVGLRAASACSEISLPVSFGLAGLVIGSGFAQFPQAPAEIGGLAGALVGGGAGLLLWTSLSRYELGPRRRSSAPPAA